MHYKDGEIIVREGELDGRMFIIQSGKVRLTQKLDGRDVSLSELKAGDLFGEMAMVRRGVWPATAAAVGNVEVLSMDKKKFLRQVHADPSLAYPILRRMSQKIGELSAELTQLKARG
jgi:CRP-like cAMP-binding protein